MSSFLEEISIQSLIKFIMKVCCKFKVFLTQIYAVKLRIQIVVNIAAVNPNQHETRCKKRETKKTQQREGKQRPELESPHVSPSNKKLSS